MANSVMNRFAKFRDMTVERIRSEIPYSLYASIQWIIYGFPPMIIIFVLIQALVGGLVSAPIITFNESLTTALKISAFLSLAVFVLYLLLAFLGMLSGFRPLKYTWCLSEGDDLENFALRLLNAAKQEGFDIVWEGSGKGFIAVRKEQKQSKNAFFHPGNFVPLRLNLRVRKRCTRPIVILTINVRTIVVWDSGERKLIESLGNALLLNAGLSPS